jgi:hypothetical protein
MTFNLQEMIVIVYARSSLGPVGSGVPVRQLPHLDPSLPLIEAGPWNARLLSVHVSA